MFHLRAASAMCFRLFDVADGIDLAACRRLVATTRPVALTREGSQYVQLPNPPLTLDLGTRALAFRFGPRDVTVQARIFDHGAISIRVEVPLEPGLSVEALIPVADELYDSPLLQEVALEVVAKLRSQLASSFEGPHLWTQHEDYTVLWAKGIDGQPLAEALLADPNLARLLLGEVREPVLSAREVGEVLNQHFSYTDRDLAVVEWNAAFLYEPSGSQDIVDLLEIANAQLLELRYYDAVLDGELQRVYDAIGGKRRSSILYSPYKQLLRDLMQTLIELSEFIERVENSLKIVGDVYLARVYEAGVAQLRIRQWTEQVSRKHRLLQQTYGLLKGEVDTERALTLEVMVVVLILLEILMALAKVAGH
ncbi:MAG: hypothetical protein JNG84_04525 [Archangium sp.]|nr:hypothetical protein [Archangium sp.]